jgi:hypothetical protein
MRVTQNKNAIDNKTLFFATIFSSNRSSLRREMPKKLWHVFFFKPDQTHFILWSAQRFSNFLLTPMAGDIKYKKMLNFVNEHFFLKGNKFLRTKRRKDLYVTLQGRRLRLELN